MIHQSPFDYIFSCKHVLLIALLLSASLPVFSQAAIIKARFEGNTSSSILIGVPIDGKYYNKDIWTALEVDKSAKSLYTEFKLEAPAFIPIKMGDMFSYFYLEPGKSLDLRVTDVVGKTTVRDVGLFGKGNSVVNQKIDDIYVPSFEMRRFIQLSRHAERFDEKSDQEKYLFLDSCRMYHKSFLKDWEVLNQKRELTEMQYKLGKIMLTKAILSHPFYILTYNKKPYKTLNNDEVEIYSHVINGIIELYGELDTSYLGVDIDFYLMALAQTLGRNAEELEPNDFHSLSKSLSGYSLLPPPFDRLRIARSLQSNFKYGFTDYSFKDAIAIYEKHYPKDGLYDVLDSLYTIAEGKRIRYTDGFGLFPDSLSTYKFYYENGQPTVGYVANFSSFESALATSGKGKTIFVDLWATWCEPCLAQFAHSKELNRKLKERGIYTVYMSIDKLADRNIWENTARGNGLEGSHVLLSSALKQELKEKYALTTIPRYMLATSDGRIMIPDASSPSNMDALLAEIDTLMESDE